MKHYPLLISIHDYANYLRNRIARLQSKLDRSPAGDLKPFKNHGHTYYCIRGQRPERKTQYLSAADPRLVRYVNKYYIKRTLPVLRQNLKAAEAFLKIHSGMEELDMAASLPLQLQKVNENLFLLPAERAQMWAAKPYDRNPYYEERLIHDTVRGDKVRSKSESMIANALFAHGQAYRIEPPLDLNGRIIYPDFAVMDAALMDDAGYSSNAGIAGDPSECPVIYWEHFGMMGDPDYAEQACRKLKEYAESGLFPGAGLICTFESDAVPLTSSMIESCIRQYFEK